LSDYLVEQTHKLEISKNTVANDPEIQGNDNGQKAEWPIRAGNTMGGNDYNEFKIESSWKNYWWGGKKSGVRYDLGGA
jgi:hypothetical protein